MRRINEGNAVVERLRDGFLAVKETLGSGRFRDETAVVAMYSKSHAQQCVVTVVGKGSSGTRKKL